MKQPSPAKPEFDPLRIGRQVKELRKAKALSLNELAALTAISEATLSRVENGQTLVSAHNLYILSQVLEVDITAFFDESPKPIRTGVRSVARLGEGVQLETARYHAQVLGADLSNKKMHPAIDTISVRSMEEAGGFNSHPGEEFIYVVSGRLVLHTEFYAPLLLVAGESIYFDGTMGHAYLNGGDAPAEILVVTTTELMPKGKTP